MPHIAQIFGISEVITGIEGEESGSRPVATQEALIAGIQMGQRVREGGSTGSLLDPIVGLTVIKSFVQELDPGAQIPGRDVSSAEYLLELDSDLQRVKEMSNAVNSGSYPRSFVEEYVRRVRADGEIEAIEWFMENAPEPAPE